MHDLAGEKKKKNAEVHYKMLQKRNVIETTRIPLGREKKGKGAGSLRIPLTPRERLGRDEEKGKKGKKEGGLSAECRSGEKRKKSNRKNRSRANLSRKEKKKKKKKEVAPPLLDHGKRVRGKTLAHVDAKTVRGEEKEKGKPSDFRPFPVRSGKEKANLSEFVGPGKSRL